jgi:hypothetical protein
MRTLTIKILLAALVSGTALTNEVAAQPPAALEPPPRSTEPAPVPPTSAPPVFLPAPPIGAALPPPCRPRCGPLRRLRQRIRCLFHLGCSS